VKWALGKSLDEKNAGSEKSLKNHAFLDRQQSGDDPGPLYSESCISKAEYLFQKVRQNYKQAISTVRQYVHLAFWQRTCSFRVEGSLTLGSTEWMNATKGIGVNCVLLWRTRPTP
jgi:hypothetical protein